MTASDSSSPSIKLALGGALALAAAMGIGRFVYTPILPFMSVAVPLPPFEAGLVASANFLGYLVGALAAAGRRLPGSQRSWFLGALAMSALTTGAMGLTDNLTLFLLLRFLGGVASAFTLVFASALVLERLTAAGHGSLSALHFSGVGCGIAGSALFVGTMAHSGWTWPSLWFASAAATTLLLLAAALLVPAKREQASPYPPQDAGERSISHQTPPSSRLYRLIAAYGLFGFGYVITATFISLIAKDQPDLSAYAERVWLVVGLTAAPSIFVWNKIASRIGPAGAFSLACLLEAIGVVLSVTGGLGAMMAGAVLLGGTFMGLTALGLNEARRIAHGDPRRILAIMTASFGLGQMTGPWVAGVLYDVSGGFELATYAAAVALVAAAALAYSPKQRTSATV